MPFAARDTEGGGRRPRRRFLLEWAGVGLAVSALVLWLALGGALQRADNAVYDALARLKGGTPDDSIVIVAIDNRSLEAIGRWPWPRRVHGQIIDRLAEAGPTAIAYDVLFVEPTEDDEALAQAIRRAGVARLPMALDPLGEDGTPWRALLPAPVLRDAAAGLGHVNLIADDDGVVRRLPLYLAAGERRWPHLALSLLDADKVPPAPASAPTPASPALVAQASTLIGWRGPPGAFRTVSAVDVLRGETPPAVLAGKRVLVGMTADGQGDRYATPTSPNGRLFPGVEVQAALLDTLLSGQAVRPAPPVVVAGVALAWLWLLMAGLLGLGPTRALALAGGLAAAAVALSAAAFTAGVWLPPLAAVAGVLLAYPLWSWRRLEAASAYMQAEIDAFIHSGEALDIPPGDHRGGDLVARQVETLRLALLRLRDLRRFFGDALKSLPDATLITDRDGRVVMANARAATLFGRDPAGGRAEALLAELGRDAALEAGDEIAAPSGAVLQLNTAPLIDAEGVSAGRILRLADLTAFRTAQRQREEALQLLSHDMRAPQASILTLLDSDHDRADPLFEQRIAQNARLTLGLAEGYVQLARAESQPLDPAPVDLGEAMMDAADLLWPQAQARGVRIDTQAPPDALVQGDRTLLTRVFLNLIDNAVKFSPDGGRVLCDVWRAGEVWRCRIMDQGPGPEPSLRPDLFAPFRHGGRSAPPVLVAGVGLGLAYVAAVAERHGGRAFYDDGDEAGGETGGETGGEAGGAFVVELPVG